jgi:hypothetical protein
MLARIVDHYVELAPNLPMGILGDADAAGFRQAFQSRRHVHPIAEDIITVGDDVVDIDADAKLDPLFLWYVGIAFQHAPLDIKRTAHRVHDAAELSQQPISGVLDDPPTVLTDLRIDERAQMALELDVRALFVQTGQAAVPSHIGRQDS